MERLRVPRRLARAQLAQHLFHCRCVKALGAAQVCGPNPGVVGARRREERRGEGSPASRALELQHGYMAARWWSAWPSSYRKRRGSMHARSMLRRVRPRWRVDCRINSRSMCRTACDSVECVASPSSTSS